MPTGRWLAAFMDRDHFARCSATMQLPTPPEPVLRRWDAARAHLAEGLTEPSAARLRPIEAEFEDHLQQVTTADLFRAQTSGRQWRLAWLRIGDAVSLQESVNLDYARAAARRYDPSSGERGLLELCLPTDVRPRGNTYHLTGGPSQGLTIHSDDLNLMVMRACIEPAQGADPGDPSVARISFLIGKPWHYVHALSVGGRIYLKNGYHRAVGLAEAGIDEIPCVVEQAEDLAPAQCERFSREVLTARRPPLVRDFLDPAMHVDVPHSRIVKVIHARLHGLSGLEIQEFEMSMPLG
jgi:hypothetical protein